MELPILTEYFALQQQIFDLFGYEENWRCIPLRDETDAYWILDQREDGTGSVVWAYKPFTTHLISMREELYSALIYTQRHLRQWVYSTPTHAMVCVDTQTDSNKFLMIFSCERRCTDDTLISLYRETWETSTY